MTSHVIVKLGYVIPIGNEIYDTTNDTIYPIALLLSSNCFLIYNSTCHFRGGLSNKKA